MLYEDEHLLAVVKPAGLNTHSAAQYAPDGLYDWLRCHESRWSSLSIIHRLDKETSGVLLFGLSPTANRSLAAQWEARSVEKIYTLLVSAPLRMPARGAPAAVTRLADGWLEVRSGVLRDGHRYRATRDGLQAVTLFRELPGGGSGGVALEARPLTGRTHQIRVHAALLGAPVVGDSLYGGAPSERLWLHAASLRLAHPASGEPLALQAPPAIALRGAVVCALLAPAETTLCRLPPAAGCASADLLGDALLLQGERAPLTADDAAALLGTQPLGAGGPTVRRVLYKRLRRDIRAAASMEDTSPRLLAGAAGEQVEVLENGARFLLRLGEGYSVGIFGDQRENRRRLMSGYVSPSFGPLWSAEGGAEVLNVFAYTCAFSVCAALGGARTTSLDLSKRYLEWGRENFVLNGLPLAAHDFIYGDALDWLARLARKGRLFHAVLLDPPTFSSSPGGGRWSAERDYPRLVDLALRVLRPGGVLFCSTNAARVAPDAFVDEIKAAVAAAGRVVDSAHYAPQPLDFPHPAAYLKTLWLRVR